MHSKNLGIKILFESQMVYDKCAVDFIFIDQIPTFQDSGKPINKRNKKMVPLININLINPFKSSKK